MTNEFRYDLLFRLARFHLAVPPLRERGDDWRLIVEHCLMRLRHKYGVAKRLSAAAMRVLADLPLAGQRPPADQPGHDRLRHGRRRRHRAAGVSRAARRRRVEPGGGVPHRRSRGDELFGRLTRGGEDFWATVYQPFMNRDLNRAQVKDVIKRALIQAEHNYRTVLELFRMPATDYQRFMDFLRHHELKP